jgi:hypothetical protein
MKHVSGQRIGLRSTPRLKYFSAAVALTISLGLATPYYAQAQNNNSAQPGVPVQMVVTVQARKGKTVPEVTKEDAMVHQGRDRRKTLDWVPLQGERAGLQLFLLIDDSANFSLGSKLDEIRDFIQAQPASTKVGVAYMQNGTARVLQELTNDHAAAAKAIRLPLGSAGGGASPFFSLQDLIKRWPEANERREVLMFTDGVDRYWGNKSGNTYVDTSLDQAQRAGILVYSIYTPGNRRAGFGGARGFGRVNWGQNYLSQIGDGSGAEAYYLGNGAPVSFRPYLDDVADKLNHQYLLTFQAKPEKKAGLQAVKVTTEVPNVQLLHASQVYVPAMPE